MGKLSSWLKALDTVRRIIVNVVFLLIIAVLIGALLGRRASVPEHGVLVLDPKGSLVEQLSVPGAGLASLHFTDSRQTRLRDLIRAIDTAAHDDHIRMMELDLGDLGPSSLDKLNAVRRAIAGFRAAGKPVVAYADEYTQGQYYLAAAANRVFLHPMGLVALTGLGMYRDYFKDAIDKLGINVQVFREGQYKSAMEPFMRNDMSASARRANQAWLSTMWDAYKQGLAQSRSLDPAHLQDVLDHLPSYLQRYGGSMAKLALGEHWVDRLGDAHAAKAWIAGKLGLSADAKLPLIGWRDYLRDSRAPARKSGPAVGIITASGDILGGEQPPGTIGAATLVAEIAQARRDKAIKALVLRIDSPGGSALASESIRQALLRFRAAGKPLVVSMGGMAASGGYWIATPADEIWANPTTLTGSIGVFGLIGDVHDTLAKLGIHTDGLGTTKIAGALRPDLPASPLVAKAMQMGVAAAYHRFLAVVAKGRKMPVAKVGAIAQGRVWSGTDALKIGLVDRLGDLDQAVASAARKAGIAAHYRRRWLAPPRSFWDSLLNRLRGEAASRLTQASVPVPAPVAEVARAWATLSRFNDPRGVYAYCDEEAGIR